MERVGKSKERVRKGEGDVEREEKERGRGATCGPMWWACGKAMLSTPYNAAIGCCTT